mgnify:CR=1 FL=1
MKDSSISKYHLFSGVSVMVIAYLTLTTVVLYLKCFKLYVPDFLDALRTQGMSANMYSDLFLIVFPAVILLLLYVVSFHFSYQYFGVLYLTQEGVLLKAPFKRRIYIPYPEIRELGIMALRIEAFAEPMFAASIITYGVFVGAADTLVPCLMNLFSIWTVRLTLAAWLAPTLGLQGVWIAMCVELCFRGLIFLVRLKRGRWLKCDKT